MTFILFFCKTTQFPLHPCLSLHSVGLCRPYIGLLYDPQGHHVSFSENLEISGFAAVLPPLHRRRRLRGGRSWVEGQQPMGIMVASSLFLMLLSVSHSGMQGEGATEVRVARQLERQHVCVSRREASRFRPKPAPAAGAAAERAERTWRVEEEGDEWGRVSDGARTLNALCALKFLIQIRRTPTSSKTRAHSALIMIPIPLKNN